MPRILSKRVPAVLAVVALVAATAAVIFVNMALLAFAGGSTVHAPTAGTQSWRAPDVVADLREGYSTVTSPGLRDDD